MDPDGIITASVVQAELDVNTVSFDQTSPSY